MHIAFYTNTYLPYISGVVRSIHSFRKTLAERGNNVFIFAQDAGGFKDTEPFIFRYPTLPILLPSDFPAAIPLSPFIDRVIPHLKLDVIHTHHPILLGLTALVKARDHNLPLVFTFHSNYEEYSQYFPIAREKAQEMIREAIDLWIGTYMTTCQHIIAPSKSMYDRIQARYEVDPDFISIIPTGIDLKPYQQLDREAIRKKLGWQDDLVLITVGRLAVEKNLDTLCHACAKAITIQKNIRLVIVGDGAERKSLEILCNRMGINQNVLFTGKVKFKEVPEYLTAADIFVFASTAETQGLVSLEAIAAGLPVAAIKGTGTVDIVEDTKEGLLCDNNADALAETILKMASNAELRRHLSAAAVRKARSFEITQMAKKMEKVYRTAKKAKSQNQIVSIKHFEPLETFGLKSIFPILFPRDDTE